MASKKQRISCNAAKCSELERLVQGWLWWSTAEHSWLEHWINDALVQALIVPFVPSASRFTLSICTLIVFLSRSVLGLFFYFFFPENSAQMPALGFHQETSPSVLLQRVTKNPCAWWLPQVSLQQSLQIRGMWDNPDQLYKPMIFSVYLPLKCHHCCSSSNQTRDFSSWRHSWIWRPNTGQKLWSEIKSRLRLFLWACDGLWNHIQGFVEAPLPTQTVCNLL